MEGILTKCLFEFVGTAILVLFGDGVVASTVLKKSKGENGGWVVITLAWGLAVMLGVFIAGPYSGAHLNPAVTLGLAAAGTFSWALVLPYIVAQMLGGFLGAVLVYLYYKDHYDVTDDPAAKLSTFCTGHQKLRKESVQRNRRNVRTCVRDSCAFDAEQSSRSGDGIAWGFSRGDADRGVGYVAWRNDRLCHQSGPGSGSPPCPRSSPDQGKRFQRLGLFVGSRFGPDYRRLFGRCAVLSDFVLR